jgi:hypothetical protein
MNLKNFGIDIGFLVSGLFGAVLMVSKNTSQNVKSVVVSLIGGMASANYMTPVVVELANIKEPKLQYGLAFITGFLGLKLVEIVSDKLLNKLEDKPKVVKSKPKNRKV